LTNETKKYFIIPHVRGISEITASIINKSVFIAWFQKFEQIR